MQSVDAQGRAPVKRLIGGLVATAVLVVTVVCLSTGCSNLGYYAQSVGGHLQLLGAARPVTDWLADPATPEGLKSTLVRSQQIRDYAVAELRLPDNASYRRYADLKRPAAVWNVVAAPETGLALKTWCFPVVGCVAYRGYYHRDEADAYASQLRAQGLDVAVYGVPAYSTLGRIPGAYFADPLLNTFIGWPEGELARLIFHELSHQVAFAPGDTEFNESFATAVERRGSQRWLAERADATAREAFALLEERRADFRAITRACREDLSALYASPISDEEKRQGKAALLERLRAEHAALKAGRWHGFAGYDAWFAGANNASLGVLAAYTELAPQFERLLERQGGDLPRFYREVQRLAALPMDDRRRALADESLRRPPP